MGNSIDGTALKGFTMEKLAEDYGVSDEDQRKKIYYNLKDVLRKDDYAVPPLRPAPPPARPAAPGLPVCDDGAERWRGPARRRRWRRRRATPTTTRRC